ncbi:lantibiotic dehydratase family protein [Curtobacterium herbarum]|uniref:lantibiotic dehydratase family protein n=1 Tax=Curtobacterium herbarum TaxID=150122 RepID=UPI001C8E927D|nr:lantibiotic dehydratase family protein [Curtobacterium herbarum]MBY0177920.1 hypothetical protein [Curtobacterium herbarum]
MTDTATRITDTAAGSPGTNVSRDSAIGVAPAVAATSSSSAMPSRGAGTDTDMCVVHHPWVLIRTNLVDLADPVDRAQQDAAARHLDAAQTDLEAAAERLVAATMPFGSIERPDPVRRAARRLARLARRSIGQSSAGDGAEIRLEDLPVVDPSVQPAQWLAAATTHDRAMRALDAVVDDHLQADRSRLRAVLAHPALRLAAPMSSPALAAAAEKYAAGRTGSSLRKSEPHLQRLAGRAVNRVSPFSHYTAVGLGWTGEPVPGTMAGTVTKPAAELERQVSVDLASFTRLVRARLEDLGPATPLVAARSNVGTDGRRRVRVDVDDASGRSRTLDGSMRTVTVRDTPAVSALLSAAQTPADATTLARRIAGSGGDVPVDPRVSAAISALVEAGALRTWNPVPVRTDDTVRMTATALNDYADTVPSASGGATTAAAVRALADDLDAIATTVDRVAAAGPDERHESVLALERAWATAGGSTARAIYEDVTMPTVVALDDAVLAPVRDDLARLAAVSDLFDNTHIGHALLHRGLVARVGERSTLSFDEFAELVPQILRETSTDREGMLAEVCAHDPAVARIVALRDEAAQSLRRAGLRGDDEVRWTEDQLDRWSREIPDRLRRPRSSLAWFVQTVRVGADGNSRYGQGAGQRAGTALPISRAVLNAVHDGDAQMFSRFLGSFGDAPLAAVRDRLADELGADGIELAPVHGFNANVHPWLLGSAFESDGLAGDQATVDPSELTVHIGAHTVWADHGGRRITPHYFGFLVPFLLPATEAALYMLGRGPLVRMDLGTDIERGVGHDEIVSHPRVVAGSVVVTRRAWSLPAAAFPVPRPGERLAETLRRMNEFRARHGIGERVFIRPEPAADALWQQFVAMRSKPLAVDLTSPLDLRCLPAWLADAARLRVTEALPDTEARPSDPFGFGSCTEYVLETVSTATVRTTEDIAAEPAAQTGGSPR